MAVTGSDDILGILEASRDIAGAIPGINAAFTTTSTVAAEDIHLPAIAQHIGLEELERATVYFEGQQQRVEFQFVLDVLVERTSDREADQLAVMPFVGKVLKVFREKFTLGYPSVIDHCWPVNWRFATIIHGNASFFGIRFIMFCRATSDVTLSA